MTKREFVKRALRFKEIPYETGYSGNYISVIEGL